MPFTGLISADETIVRLRAKRVGSAVYDHSGEMTVGGDRGKSREVCAGQEETEKEIDIVSIEMSGKRQRRGRR